MKSALFLFLLFSSWVSSKTIIILPPEGLQSLSNYVSNSEFEKRAIEATADYLKLNGENVNSFYVSSTELDIADNVFKIHIEHISTYRSNRRMADESYKNGFLLYDSKTNKILQYIYGR